MMIPRPSEITPHHLSRMAVVYIRLTLRPERSAEWGAIDAQRAQVKHARSWGWPKGLIVVIDEDIGHPGPATTARSGFRRLCQMIEAGDVGIVLVSDEARLSRSPEQLRDFLSLCARKDVLVAVDGTIRPLAEPAPTDLSAIQMEINRWDRKERFFPRGGGAHARRVAMSPDRFSREVVMALAAGFEQFGTIGAVSENTAGLTEGLPAPAARLFTGLLFALEEFEVACEEWREGQDGPERPEQGTM